jgi:hypothetical protein
MSNTQEIPSRLYEAITRNSTVAPSITRTHTNGSRIRRTSTRISHKETRKDPELDVNLPYRTLSATANLEEYTTEKPLGEIEGPIEPDGKKHYKLVTFTPNDPENPKNWSKAFKWYVTMVVAVTCFVVAFCSSVITADIAGVQKEFDVSEEVALVSISIFVVGFGLGMFPGNNYPIPTDILEVPWYSPLPQRSLDGELSTLQHYFSVSSSSFLAQ